MDTSQTEGLSSALFHKTDHQRAQQGLRGMALWAVQEHYNSLAKQVADRWRMWAETQPAASHQVKHAQLMRDNWPVTAKHAKQITSRPQPQNKAELSVNYINTPKFKAGLVLECDFKMSQMMRFLTFLSPPPQFPHHSWLLRWCCHWTAQTSATSCRCGETSAQAQRSHLIH